ncbi:MAG: NUDIX domain-containing protein [Candidatus Thorarchaeota archaeon]|nr:NUDIX domain-containing protein [Candidatus Thorarchaeota archaeon]
MSNRRYPIHPIPGVGAIVVGTQGILLARRDKAPGKGLWSIPGGGVELGESQIESVIREVKEETGVECEVLELLGTSDLITKDDTGAIEYHFLLNHYLAKAITQKTNPENADGEVKWFHPDSLPSDMASPQILNLISSQRKKILSIMKDLNSSNI